MTTTTKKRIRIRASKTEIYEMQVPTIKMNLQKKVKKIEISELMIDEDKSVSIRIHFFDITDPVYVISDKNGVSCYHFCDAHSNGNNCIHWPFAGVIAHELGMKLQQTFHAKCPEDYGHVIEPFKEYEDISLKLGIVTFEQDEVKDNSSAPSAKSPVERNYLDEWSDILEYLKSENLDASLILEIQAFRKSVFDNVQLTTMAKPPVKPNTPYMGSYLGRTIRHILSGKDIIVSGEMGSGKDTLIATISWITGLPTYLQVGNEGETKESIVGENSFADGEVFFKLSPFATSVKYGGISNYAELNMIPGKVTSVFHPVLDENRQLPTLIGTIPRHNHHVFIGSMNIGDKYVGTEEMNSALLDRCAVIELPYTLVFKDFLIAKTGLTDSDCLNFLDSIKNQIDDLIITERTGERSKTLRGYIDAALHLKKYGSTFNHKIEVVEDFILNSATRF